MGGHNEALISKNRIIIHGLFGQYYFEIDLEKPLSVLMGENGSGKTTILKIIECIGTKDFVALSKYMFEKITLINNTTQFEIKYVDLMPEPQNIIEHIKGKIFLDFFETDLDEFINAFIEMRNKNSFYYAQFMAKCFHDEPMGEQLIHHVPQLCLNTLTPGLDYIFEYKKSLEQLVKSHLDIRFFDGSVIANKLMELSDFLCSSFLSRHHVISVDLINDIKLLDDVITRSLVKVDTLEIINQFIEQYVSEKDVLKRDVKISNFNQLLERFNNIESARQKFAPIIDFLNENMLIELLHSDDLLKETQKKLSQNKVLDINSILTRFYYSDHFIESMNKSAAQLLVNVSIKTYLNKSKSTDLDFSFFTQKVMSNISTYFLPLFPVDTLMGDLCVRIITYYMMSDYDSDEINAFQKFYRENIDAFIGGKSEKIKLFENIINSFLNNKKIVVEPNGIKVFVNLYSIKNAGKYNLIKNDSNQIRVMDLSSGERKMIMIFLITIFFDDATILIDEPELSISILWQESLLEQIMEKAHSKHVIVATHSPFIINDKIINEAVISLPMEVFDE